MAAPSWPARGRVSGSIPGVISAVSHTVTRRTRVPVARLFDTVVSEAAAGAQALPGAAASGEILLSEHPTSFSYRIRALAGPPGLLATEAVGWWTFEPDGAGSRVAWTVTFTPRSRLTQAPLRWYVRMRWVRSMSRSLDRCIALALSRLA